MKQQRICKKRTLRKQKGGILIPSQNNKESFQIFKSYLNNSSSSVLSKGSFGITFLLSLNDDATIEKPYLNINLENDKFKTPVEKLIVKLCYINDQDDDEYDDEYDVYRRLKIYGVEEKEFMEEINIQTDIFLKTVKYLQPICPAIVYSGLLDGESEENKSILKKITGLSNLRIKFGIIVMELAENYSTVHKIIEKDEKVDEIKMQCLFLLIKLALDTGYTHGDHHFGNIMYNPKDTTFFKLVEGRPLLIDFGRTTKISPDVMQTFKQYCSENNYTEALKMLCNSPTANEYVSNNKYKDYYGWACGDYGTNNVSLPDFDPTTNEKIKQLLDARKEAIDENVKKMSELHDLEPEKYPLLPLSNSIKNNLYNGIFGNDDENISIGGKRKRNKQTKRKKQTKIKKQT